MIMPFHKKYILIPALLVLLVVPALSGCAGKASSPEKGGPQASHGTDQADAAKAAEEERMAKLEEEVIANPSWAANSEYFRKTENKGSKIRLFGNSKREKELEERLEKLEARLKGLPDRAKDVHGMPVLRRKVVLMSLLGDLGLDVLSLLPAALRRTDGIVPVDSNQLARLLKKYGYSVSDLASARVRQEIAALAGIQAYLLVYFPEGQVPGKESALRLDVVHATENVLIGSYLATIEQFDEVAKKISKDVVRGTEWSCRIVKVEDGQVYLNAGRLTGLRPGDRLKVWGRGKEIKDPLTGRILGFGPGPFKGELEVVELFGTDASMAKVLSGGGFELTDVVKMAELGE